MAVVAIANPAPYRSGVDISMFIRTREREGYIFYFGTDVDGDRGRRSFISGQLVEGNLVVNVFFDGKSEKFQVYTVDLSDGYRHFIRVVRMDNSMMVKVNETVSINHEIPSPTSFLAEKLYLGNFPVPGRIPEVINTTTTPRPEETEEHGPTRVTGGGGVTSQTSSAPTPATTSADSSDTDEDTTDPTLLDTTPLLLDTSQVEIETAPLQQEPRTLVKIRSRRQAAQTQQQGESVQQAGNEDATPSATPAPTSPPPPRTTPKFFKGVIQDVQISNGANNTRIVELFSLELEDVERPTSIGHVTLFNVMKGVVSDDTCQVNPCSNGGACQVTWNDYQ